MSEAGAQSGSWLHLPSVLAGVAQPPSQQLDPYLDAAARCFARFGIRRTSVQDVARELGVDRTTVYRQVGNVEQMARLLAARDLHRVLSSLPTRILVPFDARGLVETMASVVEEVRTHPVVAKVLADDPDSITLSSLSALPPLLAQGAATLGPMLEMAMRAGSLAVRDPQVVAEWLLRLVVTLVLVPPLGDLRDFLAEVLVPALSAAPSSPNTGDPRP